MCGKSYCMYSTAGSCYDVCVVYVLRMLCVW